MRALKYTFSITFMRCTINQSKYNVHGYRTVNWLYLHAQLFPIFIIFSTFSKGIRFLHKLKIQTENKQGVHF